MTELIGHISMRENNGGGHLLQDKRKEPPVSRWLLVYVRFQRWGYALKPLFNIEITASLT